MTATISLLTDFGYRDGYVGVMKGVIAGICPTAQMIDLTHGIEPQDITAARFVLLNAYPYLPKNTIHTVVVDPGVGTSRRAIAIQTPEGYLVGPDNGVFSGVVAQFGASAAVSLTNARYWRTSELSKTFHGRDLFAPVAAHLAAGVPLENLGEPVAVESLDAGSIPEPDVSTQKAIGHVQHIDHFGNIITTISAAVLRRGNWRLALRGVSVALASAYDDVATGQAVALEGSHGWMEIAVNGGSAAAYFQLAVGASVQLDKG